MNRRQWLTAAGAVGVMSAMSSKFTKVPFTWCVALGSALTFVVGYAASFVLVETTRGEHMKTTTWRTSAIKQLED